MRITTLTNAFEKIVFLIELDSVSTESLLYSMHLKYFEIPRLVSMSENEWFKIGFLFVFRRSAIENAIVPQCA